MDETEATRHDNDSAEPRTNSHTGVKIGIGFFFALLLLVALNMN